MLVVLPIVGAAIGATAHPPPARPYLAEAVVVPTAAASAQRQEAATVLAEILQLPSVRADADRELSTTTRVETAISPSGLLTLRTRAESQASALTFANALAERATQLGERIGARANGVAGIVVGDFERGVGNWARPSKFLARPRRLAVNRSTAHSGRSSLLVVCPRIFRGCGAATVVTYPFVAGVAYTVTAWVREAPLGSPRRTPLRLVFGSTSSDIVTTRPTAADPGRWRKLSASWVPGRDSGAAEIGVQVSDGSARFLVDDVEMTDPIEPTQRPVVGDLDAREERRLLDAARAARILPARSVMPIESSTLRWALIGLGGGAILALSGLVFGWLAARRR